MMYPDPMFYPGYYPNSAYNYFNQFYNPAYLQNARDRLLNQFDDEFDSVMGDYNRKMAKLQLMKNDLYKQNYESHLSKPQKLYPSKSYNHIRELMEVVDDNSPLRISGKTPEVNNYLSRTPGHKSGYMGSGRSNYINRIMFGSDEKQNQKSLFYEKRGTNPYVYKSKLGNSTINPRRNMRGGDNIGGYDIENFIMGYSKK